MTTKQIEISSKVMTKYLNEHPETTLFDLVDLSLAINDEVERRGDKAEKEIDDILKTVDKKLNNSETSLLSVVNDLFGGSHKREDKCKCECKCDTKAMQDNNHSEKPNAGYSITSRTWISDTQDMKTVKILVPGVNKENIVLTVDNCILKLSLRGVVSEPFVDPGLRISVALSDNCDTEHMKASLQLGILTVEIPKIKKNNTKVVDIM